MILQRLSHRTSRGIRSPLIEMLPEKDDWHKHQPNQPDRARHRLQRASEQQSPLTAADILQHQHHQAAARKAEADHIAQQISTQEMVPSLMTPWECKQRDKSGNRTDDQRTRPPCGYN